METPDVKPEAQSVPFRDPPDLRPVAELRFGAEWKPSVLDLMADRPLPEELVAKTISEMAEGVRVKDKREPTEEEKSYAREVTIRSWQSRVDDEAVERWKAVHGPALDTLREILKTCGCAVAEDVKKLGCTGIAAHEGGLEKVAGFTLAENKNTVVAIGRFVRIGLGGSGVGLPCFVPQSRYCLVHDTIGGLQEGQKAHYETLVESISRPLMPMEQGRVQLTERARRTRGADRRVDAMDALSGFKLPEGFEVVEADAPPPVDEDEADDGERPIRRLRAWTCSDHDTPNWACRYCMAQAVVEGPLLPVFVLDVPEGRTHASVTPDELLDELVKLDEARTATVEISVRVATLKRKLSRE